MTWQVEHATEPSQAPEGGNERTVVEWGLRMENKSRFGSEIDRQ